MSFRSSTIAGLLMVLVVGGCSIETDSTNAAAPEPQTSGASTAATSEAEGIPGDSGNASQPDEPPGEDEPADASTAGEVVDIRPAESLTSLGIEVMLGQTGDYNGVELTVTAIRAADISDLVEDPSTLGAIGGIEVVVTGTNRSPADAALPSITVLCDDGSGALDLGETGLSFIVDPDTVFAQFLAPNETVDGSARLTLPECTRPVLFINRSGGRVGDGLPPAAHVQLPESALP